MRNLLILILLLISVNCMATNYYVSSSDGNDLNSGLSTSSAWASLAKVNASSFTANDSILLKSGDIFYGSWIPTRSNINIGYYGTGNKPLITGFTTITSLSSAGGNRYGTTITNADYRLNMVTLNGEIQIIGRWPNVDSVGLNEGWKRFSRGVGGDPDSTTIIGAIFGLNYPNPDTTSPKHMVLKNQFYRIVNTITTAHIGDSIFYKRAWGMTSGGSNTMEKQPNGGRGFYFTRDSSYLDQRGEYYLDSVTKRFLIYLPGGLGSNVLKVATVDTLIAVGTRNDISVTGIAFEGTNLYGVFSDGGNRVKVTNCTFNDIGGCGVDICNSSNSIVTLSTFNNNLETAIRFRNTAKDTATITYNNISNTGRIVGQGSFNHADYSAISSVVRSGMYVAYNNVDNSGAAGINFNGQNAIVEYNYVSYFDWLLSDIGGIYTFNQGNAESNVSVNNNFVTAGYGNWAGTTITNGNRDVAYIYYDGDTDSVTSVNNTIWGQDTFNVGTGFQTSQGTGMGFTDNTVYNITNISMYMGKTDTTPISITSKRNVFYQFPNTVYNGSSKRTQYEYYDGALNGYTILQSVQRSLISDSNWFNRTTLNNFVLNVGLTDSKRNLSAWKSYTGKDINSIGLPDYGKDSAKLFVNPTANVLPCTISFNSYDPVTGIIYYGAFSLPPYSSRLLLYSPSSSRNGVRTNKIPVQKIN